MSQFDSLIIGEVARDTNVDYDGTTVQAIGGAVYYSGFAAANIGHKIAVLPKADMLPEELEAAFAKAPNATVYALPQQALLCDQKTSITPRTGSGAPPQWTVSSIPTVQRKSPLLTLKSGTWRVLWAATSPTR